jgi:hypothetical protein
MAMGKKGEEQDELFVPYRQMRSAGHSFFQALDGMLHEHGFERYAESCAPGAGAGRLLPPPGSHLLLLESSRS